MQALSKSKNIRIEEITVDDNKNQFDIIHYPYFDPFFLTLPFKSPVPTVVTIHDLIPLRLKKYYPAGIKGKIKWEIQKRVIRTASHICTDSFSSKEDIKKYLAICDERISVVYGGVDEVYYLPISQKIMDETAKKYNIIEKFILYVGDINYNKNIPGLLTAFSQIIQKENIDLILVGPAFTQKTVELDEIKQKIKDLSLGEKVKLVNYVSNMELRSLYKLASLYVQSSFAEGFGLSVLEAMASGCPVVSSRETSLKEICADVVVPINPYDETNISEGIIKALKDETLRNKNIQKGIAQAKKFTWEDAALKTEEIYLRVLAQYEKQE